MEASERLTLRRIERDGEPLEYAEMGAGPPLLLLQPMFASPTVSWNAPSRGVLLELAQSHRLILHGLRGEVRPAKKQEGPAPFSPEDSVAVLDAVDTERAFVCASFLSVPWAVALASRHPDRVRGIILWNGVLSHSRLVAHPRARGIRAMRTVDPQGSAHAWAEILAGIDASGASLAQVRALMARGQQLRPPDLFALFDATDDARHVACPTLVVIPRRADFPPADLVQELAAAIPGAGVQYIDESAASFGFVRDDVLRIIPEFTALHGGEETGPSDRRPVTVADGRFGLLTAREMEVASHVSSGQTNAEIAAALSISPFTVRRHVSNILGKIGVSNRTELAAAVGRVRPDWQ